MPTIDSDESEELIDVAVRAAIVPYFRTHCHTTSPKITSCCRRFRSIACETRIKHGQVYWPRRFQAWQKCFASDLDKRTSELRRFCFYGTVWYPFKVRGLQWRVTRG